MTATQMPEIVYYLVMKSGVVENGALSFVGFSSHPRYVWLIRSRD